MCSLLLVLQAFPSGKALLYFLITFFLFFSFSPNWRYHLGDYGGEILNEVKLNRPEKEMSTTPSTLHNGNHHKVQECKIKVTFLLLHVRCYLLFWTYPADVRIGRLSSNLLCLFNVCPLSHLSFKWPASPKQQLCSSHFLTVLSVSC